MVEKGMEILKGAANTRSQSRGTMKKNKTTKKKPPTLNCQGHLPELLKSEGTAGFVTHLLVVPAFLGAPAESADALWA